MNKTIKVLYCLFFAVIVVVVLMLLSSLFPIFGGFKFFVVQSGSMEPVIKTGSVVMIKPKTDYKIGDVISFSLYNKNETPTTHRIRAIKIKNGVKNFVTQGDANNAPDMVEVKKENIIGKAVLAIPLVGYLIAVSHELSGYLALILIPALVIIGDEILKIIKEARKKRQEKDPPPDKNIPFYVFCLGLGLSELLFPPIHANSFFSATETVSSAMTAGAWSEAFQTETSVAEITTTEPAIDFAIDTQTASVSISSGLAAPPAPPTENIPIETVPASSSAENP